MDNERLAVALEHLAGGDDKLAGALGAVATAIAGFYEEQEALAKSLELIAQTVGLILLAIASGKVATTPEIQNAAAQVSPDLLEKLGVKKKETSGIVIPSVFARGS